MATQTVTATKLSSLVLHLSIPVTHGKRWSRQDDELERESDRAERCDDESTEEGGTVTEGSQLRPNASRHNTGTDGSASSATSASGQPGYEGDNISPAYFRRMTPAPRMARRQLLLVVEPRRMAPRRQWVRARGDSRAEIPAPPVMTDFCIPFDRDLLKKLRTDEPILQSIADRTCSLMYIRKTLLLRGTYRTKTWAKYLMCRFYSLKQPLLKRCFCLLEQFDKAFCSRQRCQHERPRVTLLLNQSVPENTALSLSRQRLRNSDDYFGKMPLLPDPHLDNLAARLTQSCVSSGSLLAQLVAVEP